MTMKPSSRWLPAAVAALLLVFALPVHAAVRLAKVFSDHMVLQRDMALPVWGWAEPGEQVTVSIAGQSATAKAGDDGKWKLSLPKLAAGGPHTLTVKAPSGEAKVTDVLVGEVWVCSGQSNMAWTVAQANNPKQEIEAAHYPMIRLLTVPRRPIETPQDDINATWTTCSSQTVGSFSAVGYFFGRELHKELNVPIGLINTSFGGTPSEAWTRRGALEEQKSLDPLLARWDKSVESFDPQKAKQAYETQLAKWQEQAKQAKEAGKPAPRKPNAPGDPRVSQHRPANLYNGMIAPLVPYGVRGAIWYQGESNAGRAFQYRTAFSTMIESWRADWGQGDFPFYFVQLANFKAIKSDPGESDWAELREAQSMTLKLPNTGQAVIIDIGEASDIHPRNKQDVGKRLALWALAKDYGKDVVFSGPSFKSMSRQDGRIVLEFDHVGGGLVARGGDELKGFAIAGADRKFVWAKAQIKGDTIIVSSDQVADPVAVRYGWADNPQCNLYNKAGLPASPFRTDDWPGVTVNNH